MDVKAAISNVVIVGAALTALSTLIDWFLNDAQRIKLSSVALRIWSWLDDTQKRAARFRLNEEAFDRNVALIALIGGLCASLAFAVSVGLYALIVGLIVGWLSLTLLFWLPALERFRYRFFLIWPPYVRALTAFGIFLVLFVALAALQTDWIVSFSVGLVFGFFGALFLMSALMLVAAILVGLIIIPSLKLFLIIIEILARRVAESPNGPVLAVSAAVGCVATMAKVFQ
jgi:hypothetical protein